MYKRCVPGPFSSPPQRAWGKAIWRCENCFLMKFWEVKQLVYFWRGRNRKLRSYYHILMNLGGFSLIYNWFFRGKVYKFIGFLEAGYTTFIPLWDVSLLTGIAQCLPDVNWLGFSGTSSSVKRLGDKMVGWSFIVARYAQSLSQRSNSDPGSASGARLHSNVCDFFAVFTPRACARGIKHVCRCRCPHENRQFGRS